MIGFHFVGATLRDGRSIPEDGEWLVHAGPVVICESGLHASIDPFDALQYACGATLCKVECEDVVEQQLDKLVCRRRRIIQRGDATELLRYFARMQALSVIDLWDSEPADVVLDYLMGDDAAWSAARSAARSAAESAAWSAAWSAARSAAWSAARSAAWSAAWSAARSAAWSAAESAARSAQREHFNNLVNEFFDL